MFAIPMSTPRNPSGSIRAGSATSTVAYRNHMLSWWTRSDSPTGRVATAFELVRRPGVGDTLQPPVDRPDRYGAGVALPRQHPRVVRLRGLPPQAHRVGLGVAPPFRP